MLVGPDNGLLGAGGRDGGRRRAGRGADQRRVPPAVARATFAGRDIFAPVAGHLCNGVDLAEFGELIDADESVAGHGSAARRRTEGLVGEVLWVDHFGNCQLNIGPDEIADWGPQLQVSFGESQRVATRQRTFSDVATGAVGLVVDSCGMLALVLDQRSAAMDLGIGPGDQVTLVAVDRRSTDGDDQPGERCVPARFRRMRPATTLTLALLLIVILTAGVISLLRL